MAEPKPFLTVFAYDTDHTVHSYTMFTAKLHFRLRHAGIPYANAEASRNQAPKSKVPYVRFEETKELMGDSSFITQKLVDMGKLEDLNKGLSPEERAKDFCLRSMIDDRVYFFLVYERWCEDYKTMRDEGPTARIPWGVRHLVAGVLYRYCAFMVFFQGTGRHKPAELEQLRREAIGAMADYADAALARADKDSPKPFWILGGDKPTEADFTLFGLLSGTLATTVNSFSTGLIKEHPSLMSYVERIHNTYFSDFKSPF